MGFFKNLGNSLSSHNLFGSNSILGKVANNKVVDTVIALAGNAGGALIGFPTAGTLAVAGLQKVTTNQAVKDASVAHTVVPISADTPVTTSGHAVLGAGAGALAGFMVAGPVGALVGAGAGLFISK
jgi:hypothetical protein